MSDVFDILDRAALYLTTTDAFRGVLLASTEVRAEVLAHAEVVMIKSASATALATVFVCQQLTTLNLEGCQFLTALPDRLGDWAALRTLNLYYHQALTAPPGRLGDCAALATLDLSYCYGLTALHG